VSEGSKKPRAGSMSDVARAHIGRGRTNPHAIPAFVETELTPPPQEPPHPSTLPGYDTIPPPIKQQLDLLADSLGTLTVAMGRVWDARNDGERFDRVDAKLGTLAQSATKHETILESFVVPALKDQMKATDEVAMQLPRIATQLEGLAINVQNLDSYVRGAEVDRKTTEQKQHARSEALEVRLVASESRANQHDVRIDDIERKTETKEAVTKALSKRHRRSTGGLAAAVASLVAAIAALINHYA